MPALLGDHGQPEGRSRRVPEHPKVLYTGEAEKFVHSARWPRGGRDKFVLTGGEMNFTGRCASI